VVILKNCPSEILSFDLVIDRMSVTHNSEMDIDNIIAEVSRVMKKNSIFISSFHSNKNPDLTYGQKKVMIIVILKMENLNILALSLQPHQKF
jgi:nucleoside-triphosphatase THEP1